MKKYGDIIRFDTMVFLGFAGLCTLNSYLALHFRDIGFSNAQIGVLYSIFYFLGGLTIPLFNPLVKDTSKLQKLMPVFYCLGSVAVLTLLILSKSYAVAVLAMITFSIAKGVGFPMFESSIMLFSEYKKIEYANIRLIGSLAFVLFNLIGGKIADNFGFEWIFACGICFYIICAILAKHTAVSMENHSNEAEKEENNTGSVIAILKNKKFILFLFGQLFLGSLYIATESFSMLYYDYRGISVTSIGLMSSFVVAIEMVAMLALARPLSKLNGALGQILLGVLMLSRCFCYAFNAPIPVIFGVVIIAGIQSGVYICITMKYIRSILGINHIGSGYLLNTMMVLLMSGVINISSGFIVDNFSFKAMYFGLATIVIIGMIGTLCGYFVLYKKKA